MKKFLTFFAMMLALLTGVLPAQAFDFYGTVTVDIANTGWTSALISTSVMEAIAAVTR